MTEQTQTQTVLLLGEESPNRQLLVEGLCRRGYQVIKARSAREAERALDVQPGIVVVDQRVRGTNGLAWIRGLREDGYTMPVVFCSASNCSVKTFNVLRNLLKVSLIVRKPLEPMRLISQMESLLESTEGGGTSGGDQNDVLQFHPAPSEEQEEWLKAYTSDCEMKKALEVLGRSYLGEMPETLYELRGQISGAMASDKCQQDLMEATDTAHRIKGTAGSLGFAELSRMAGNIDCVLREFSGESGDRQPLARALIIVAEIEMWLEAWQDDQQRWSDDNALTAEEDSNSQPVAGFDQTNQLKEASAVIVHSNQLKLDPGGAFSLPSSPPAESAGSIDSGSERRIFIVGGVDGDAGNGESLANLLRAEGNWRVETFAAGLRVLTALEESQPDVLVLNAYAENDFESRSPGGQALSGLDICRMIRCHPRWARLSIMIMTSDAGPDMRQEIF